MLTKKKKNQKEKRKVRRKKKTPSNDIIMHTSSFVPSFIKDAKKLLEHITQIR